MRHITKHDEIYQREALRFVQVNGVTYATVTGSQKDAVAEMEAAKEVKDASK